MAYVLNIETSGEICSVAVSKDNVLLNSLESEEKQSHAATLTRLIEEALLNSNIKIENLGAIAVSKGPGSYTGLRIGVSTAKGICYALNIPLIAINSLESLAKGILKKEKNNLEYLGFTDDDCICIMTDARRMEVYTALFNSKGKAVSETSAMIVDENMHESVMQTRKVFFAGTGAEKASSIIKNQNAVFLYGFKARAEDMISSAFESFSNKTFENTAYFEPFYLKDFFTSKPKKDILK